MADGAALDALVAIAGGAKVTAAHRAALREALERWKAGAALDRAIGVPRVLAGRVGRRAIDDDAALFDAHWLIEAEHAATVEEALRLVAHARGGPSAEALLRRLRRKWRRAFPQIADQN